MDRIKRLSCEVLDEHKSKFGEDFADNKKILDQVSIIRSKGLKNEIAGYITKFIKKEIRDKKVKQAQIESSQSDKQVEPKVLDAPEPATESAAETVAETTPAEEPIVETTPAEESIETSEKTE